MRQFIYTLLGVTTKFRSKITTQKESAFMSVSYSFHVGNGKNSLSSCAKIKSADKHNLRKYNSDTFDKSKIVTICGTDNIFKDVQRIYQSEFDEVVKTYNASQKRKDRQIDDYLQSVSDSNKDVAVEIIMQVGDMDFWKSVPFESDDIDFINPMPFSIFDNLTKKDTIRLYQEQLVKLQELLPDFKIANATVHLDESSPHMHVIGVPVADGFKKGLTKQVSKRSVFTQASLVRLQEEMHSFANEQMNTFGLDIKDKSKGHSYFSKELLVVMKQLKKKKGELADLDHKLKNTLSKLTEADLSHLNLKNDVKCLEEQKSVLNRQIETLKANEKSLRDMTSFYTKELRKLLKELDESLDDVSINNTLTKLDDVMSNIEEQVSVPELIDELKEVHKKTKTKIDSRSGKAR